MKFGLFYELQVPRPWDDRSEHRVITEALEQIELADRLGFHCAWAVEHHFLEEYSHCTAPEVFLAAAAQRTKNIRLGHGIMTLLTRYNHPARVAERIATLDLISGGRVEFGTGESGSRMEIEGFAEDVENKTEIWKEVIAEVPRMFVEEPYGGHDGPAFSMPVRNVIPKPLQKPHPPIWGAATRKEKIPLMGERGIGALAFGLIEPERAREWVDLYYESLAADDSAAVGYAVNPNIAFATAFSCAEDEEEAIARGIDGAHFFSFSIHHWVFDSHRPGRTNMFEAFESTRDERGLARDAVLAEGKPLTTSVNEERPGARLLGSMQRSQRGGVGTPDQLRDFARRWEASGADQLMLIAQAGNTRHEHICESLELFGTKVLPEFIERDAKAEKEKAKRLETVIERLLSRAPADRDVPEVVVEPFNRYEVPKPA